MGQERSVIRPEGGTQACSDFRDSGVGHRYQVKVGTKFYQVINAGRGGATKPAFSPGPARGRAGDVSKKSRTLDLKSEREACPKPTSADDSESQ